MSEYDRKTKELMYKVLYVMSEYNSKTRELLYKFFQK